jgi:ribosomal protein S12 methylthiotransferase accessory factor
MLIALIGDGLLADTLDKDADVRRIATLDRIPPECRLIVVAADGWDDSAYHEVREAAAKKGVAWLPARTELGRAIVGPVELPGIPGCNGCVDRRRRLTSTTADGIDAVRRRHGTALAQQASTWLTTLAADVVAGLVTDEATLLIGPDTPRTRCAYLAIDLADLDVRTHRFLPDPLCPTCGQLVEDTADLAEISPAAQPKQAVDRYRVRSVASEVDTLLDTYVDPECGVIRSVSKGHDGAVVIAAAPVGLRIGASEYGFGRSRSYRDSQVTAVLEALERYGGTQPGGKKTIVRASYAEIQDQAVDPRTLGLYPAERHRLPGFRYQQFEETKACRWVWGYSFGRQESVLVPENYAYYGVARDPDADRPFVFETSNGCALGSCLEEAILHGILEVAERDAFLMTWYARLPAPRIDLGSAQDRAIPLLVEALHAETGYQAMAFDTTLEQDVPCVWVMAVAPEGDGSRPKAVCAAGAHLDPERALENALSELGPILTDLIRRYETGHERAARLATNPSLVSEMADHSLLYGNPDVFSRLEFLTTAPPTRTTAAMAQPSAFRSGDLTEDLTELVGRYLATGLDVIVVDQTTPEHQAGGFSCVKVIIPGTLPMTFGHDVRRVDGLPRLFDVPRRLGKRLRAQDVNPDPHPFP